MPPPSHCPPTSPLPSLHQPVFKLNRDGVTQKVLVFHPKLCLSNSSVFLHVTVVPSLSWQISIQYP